VDPVVQTKDSRSSYSTWSVLTGRRGPRPASGSRATGAAGRGCTTRQLKTHNSDLHEVFYPWHPWSRRTVIVVTSVSRDGRDVFRCQIAEDERCRALELPSWMFDRNVCGRMRLGILPVVAWEHLVQLQSLLKGRRDAAGRDRGLQDQHRPLPTMGGADANETPPPGAAGLVSDAARPADVANDAVGGPIEDRPAPGSLTPVGARAANRGRRSKGGRK
jgi:hypothetical protein